MPEPDPIMKAHNMSLRDAIKLVASQKKVTNEYVLKMNWQKFNNFLSNYFVAERRRYDNQQPRPKHEIS